jgi:hypothetical protein
VPECLPACPGWRQNARIVAERRRWLAWSLGGLAVALAVCASVLAAVGAAHRPRLAELPDLAYLATFLVFALVGTLVAARHPGNPVGWLLLAGGLSWELAGFAAGYVNYALCVRPGALPGASSVAWALDWLWVPGFILVPFVFLLLPGGRLPSRRWRTVAWAVGGVGVLLFLRDGFMPGPYRGDLSVVTNPFGIPGAAPLLRAAGAVADAAAVAVFLAAVASLVVRFRAARGRSAGNWPGCCTPPRCSWWALRSETSSRRRGCPTRSPASSSRSRSRCCRPPSGWQSCGTGSGTSPFPARPPADRPGQSGPLWRGSAACTVAEADLKPSQRLAPMLRCHRTRRFPWHLALARPDPGGVHLWLRWIAATTIGVVGGMLGLFAVLAPFGELLEADAVFLVVFPLTLGGVAALVAGLQRRTMRRAVPLHGAWVWAGAAGLAVGLALALLLGEGSGLAGKVLEGARHVGVIGLLTGALQWRFALRDGWPPRGCGSPLR